MKGAPLPAPLFLVHPPTTHLHPGVKVVDVKALDVHLQGHWSHTGREGKQAVAAGANPVPHILRIGDACTQGDDADGAGALVAYGSVEMCVGMCGQGVDQMLLVPKATMGLGLRPLWPTSFEHASPAEDATLMQNPDQPPVTCCL